MTTTTTRKKKITFKAFKNLVTPWTFPFCYVTTTNLKVLNWDFVWYTNTTLDRGHLFILCICIQPPESILSQTICHYNYSCKSFEVCRHQLWTSRVQFAHSSLQNSSSTVRLDGERLWTHTLHSMPCVCLLHKITIKYIQVHGWQNVEKFEGVWIPFQGTALKTVFLFDSNSIRETLTCSCSFSDCLCKMCWCVCGCDCLCRMEPAGGHALRDAPWPTWLGQVQTATAGDAGEEMAGPLSGGMYDAIKEKLSQNWKNKQTKKNCNSSNGHLRQAKKKSESVAISFGQVTSK